MKRVDIYYGGRLYTVSGREFDEIRSEVARALTSDEPTWYEVNVGEGRYQAAHLLLTRGVDLALVPVADQ